MDRLQSILPLYSIYEPAEYKAPVIFNVPHAGRNYTQDFLASSRLDALTLRWSEDAYVDQLYAEVVQLGAPLLVAHFPRAYLDVNREPFELDPRLFIGKIPSYANVHSARVASGLGTIARIVTEGQNIYPSQLPLEEGLWRIENIFKPYHRALREQLQIIKEKWGAVLLVDCHSMPKLKPKSRKISAPDIIIGDRFGTSCSPIITNLIESAFKDMGYRVGRNRPYAGGYITEHYGQPVTGCHAVQIELSRTLYMDESTLELSQNFAKLSHDLLNVSSKIMKIASSLFSPAQMAAE